MNTSNLALRLDEFDREHPSPVDARQAPQLKIVAAPGAERARPRRLSLTTRRGQSRGQDLRQFRVC
jgi:hypothetical protein